MHVLSLAYRKSYSLYPMDCIVLGSHVSVGMSPQAMRVVGVGSHFGLETTVVTSSSTEHQMRNFCCIQVVCGRYDSDVSE